MIGIGPLYVHWHHAWCAIQGTAAIEYSWLPRDATPHNWTTEVISDLSLPITFVGLCTIDRRNIYPQKEVLTNLVRLQIVSPSSLHCLFWELGHAQCSMCQVLHTITLSCIANINLWLMSLQAVTRRDPNSPFLTLLLADVLMCPTATFAHPDVCVCKFAEVHLSIRLQCVDQRRKTGAFGERCLPSGSPAWLHRHGHELRSRLEPSSASSPPCNGTNASSAVWHPHPRCWLVIMQAYSLRPVV